MTRRRAAGAQVLAVGRQPDEEGVGDGRGGAQADGGGGVGLAPQAAGVAHRAAHGDKPADEVSALLLVSLNVIARSVVNSDVHITSSLHHTWIRTLYTILL